MCDNIIIIIMPTFACTCACDRVHVISNAHAQTRAVAIE